MAVPCNAGFTELAKLGAGEAANAWTHIALGTGTGQGASSTTLATETSASGMARVAAQAVTTETTTVTDDTIQLTKVFTSGATVTISEAGAFNAGSGGDMLMVGDLSPVAGTVSGDTLTITLKCQIKAAA
mgnify:CR=1 FL=1|jgi:hypothetical protein